MTSIDFNPSHCTGQNASCTHAIPVMTRTKLGLEDFSASLNKSWKMTKAKDLLATANKTGF